ncbi:MAG: FMN reductase [Pseudonocardiaceae bacterium]|nr:FMN reductase [Pseudonocardiaceae bacterium]
MAGAVGNPPFVVGLGGTTRPDSSTERALRFSLSAAADGGAETLLLRATDLELPMYAPERPDRTPAAQRLVDALAAADGVIVASPGYHGSFSGLIKNALDYAEDLRDNERPYLDGRAVGCIACAYGWQATTTTLVALRSVVHALRAWPTPLGVGINTAQPAFGPDGSVVDDTAAANLALLGHQVVEFAHQRAASDYDIAVRSRHP